MDEQDILRDENYEYRVPTKWDLFEVMDRSSTIVRQFEDALNNHVGFNDDQARKAYQAFSLLFDIYQSAGARFFEATKDEE
jgi:hypothetical protein